MKERAAQGEELGLCEMLADPMVTLLMARDGVTADQVDALVRTLSRGAASSLAAACSGVSLEG